MKKDYIPFSIVFNREVAKDYFWLRLEITEKEHIDIINSINVGNFATINIEGFEIFFKRPFSIFDFDPYNGTIDFLYKVIGRATLALSNLPQGYILKVLLPLGNSFPIIENKDVIIVAGGIGIAALIKLAEILRSKNNKIEFFWGIKSKENFFFSTRLEEISDNLYITTEDGSLGEQGLITNSLYKFIYQHSKDLSNFIIYGCGPTPLLRVLSDLSRIHRIPSYLSFENKMACGIGTCQGCVIKVKEKDRDTIKYKRVCYDGPIFRGEDVVYEL